MASVKEVLLNPDPLAYKNENQREGERWREERGFLKKIRHGVNMYQLPLLNVIIIYYKHVLIKASKNEIKK